MSTDYGFRFDNRYARLPDALFARTDPQPVAAPRLLLWNRTLAGELGLDRAALDGDAGAALFGGNALPDGAEPLAQAYAGHQFGNPTMLGDGRAVLLGEQITPDGRRRDIQLKGAGRTPFSRGGDGRAALGPMLREYLISEAMHALGIPTTRSLAVVANGEPVFRDGPEPGAVLTRVAASHLRVGTFQYAAARRDPDLLRTLFEYTLERHYAPLKDADNPALALLEAVMERHIDLVVAWMRVGFIHGVLNTDNVTLSGETIDYGPCAFMDVYHPDTVFSSIDQRGRYAYGNQPVITQWNLARLAETLVPLIDDDPKAAVARAEALLGEFGDRYEQRWRAMMADKLGLLGEEEGDRALVDDLLDWMRRERVDYTNTFRGLIGRALPDGEAFYQDAFLDWHRRWRDRLGRNPESDSQAEARMRAANPALIPRNHQVEAALNAAEHDDDLAPTRALLEALANPYQDRALDDPYTRPPTEEERVLRTFCGT
ncbi:MAG: protein adenylyltransferase SelO [Alcanivorax sp.]|uniref:protein adenylyltransferase SelO n=1 Tax=Alloalcanivorax marinus TaxID=1177169 RepID=UPI00195EFDCD|nr:YdiU family protein [Alloalcanivorax marinus]MBM7334917.1 YdiU family protein [Alloalcanivorax marinus]